MKSGCGRGMRHAPEVWKGEVGMPGISGDSDKPDRRPDLTGRPEHQLRSSGPTSPSRHTRNTRNSRNSRKRPIPHPARPTNSVFRSVRIRTAACRYWPVPCSSRRNDFLPVRQIWFFFRRLPRKIAITPRTAIPVIIISRKPARLSILFFLHQLLPDQRGEDKSVFCSAGFETQRSQSAIPGTGRSAVTEHIKNRHFFH